MSNIFISDAREDREKAKDIAQLFEQQNWSVWWDRNIPPGKSFDQVIEEEIAAAQCMVVLWSKKSVGANWVKAEAGEGVARGILVPVMIESVNLPLEFRRLQTVDLSGWNGTDSHPELAEFLKAVGAQIKAPLRNIPVDGKGRRVRAQLIGLTLAAIVLAAAVFGFLKISSRLRTPQKRDGKESEPTTQLVRTPNLGLEFWQDNQQRPMLEEEGPWNRIVHVLLKKGPFELRCPSFDGALQVCAWTDDSIFTQIERGRELKQIPYLFPGTGMADSIFGSAHLFLTNRGHHYLIDERRKKLSDREDSVFFSRITNENGPVLNWPTLYLVAFEDRNGDQAVEVDEFERLILEFK